MSNLALDGPSAPLFVPLPALMTFGEDAKPTNGFTQFHPLNHRGGALSYSDLPDESGVMFLSSPKR